MSGKSVCTACLVLVMSLGSIASADLLGYWKFNENGGTNAADSSGNGYDGTLLGPTWTVGKEGSALGFDGVDDYVLCAEREGTGPGAYPEQLMPETFTVSCWTKLDNFAYFSSFVGNGMDTGSDECGFFLYNWGWVDDNERDFGLAIRTETAMSYVETPNIYETDIWYHVAATYDGADVRIYIDGSLVVGPTNVGGPMRWISESSGNYPERFAIGVWLDPGYDLWIDGIIDEVGYWDSVLTEPEIQAVMEGSLEYPYALGPVPKDGALIEQTWVNLSWSQGDFAVSHDVYIGDSFDDVNNADPAAPTFRGNQSEMTLPIGFPGFPFPDGLVPGTTYYWRIDEVNEADPNSPWKGNVWSFSIPPKTAYSPDPADGAAFVDPNATFVWTPGYGARLHTVYLGDNYDDVGNASGGTPLAGASYDPGTLEREKVLYWRVDEFDGLETYKGDIWSFTTPGAAGNPQPANGAVDVQIIETLAWTPADTAASSDLYFGTDADAVESATAASPEFMGNKALGSERHDPGKLALKTTYYWRVDAIYPDRTVKGLLWSFAAADFLLVDDFEAYNDIDPPDPNSNRIFDKWVDGFETTTNGALVGNELPPYAGRTVVHGGDQAMPYSYDNNLKTSEATLTLVYPRDWTEQGVTRLSLWFNGDPGNAAERMFIALNGNAVVYHDDQAATQLAGWNQWVIDLQQFADQGVILTNVNTVTIGFGTKDSPAAGGSGQMDFDDIGLYR